MIGIKIKTITIGIALMFIAVLFTALPVDMSASGTTWWDTDWDSRVMIVVEDNSGSALTDFQVLMTLDTASLISAGQMNADGSDIRFTDSSNNEVSYYIESGINTADTRIWVKVPSIPASGQSTLYLYYGNPAAGSASDGEAVFLFFDDFNDDVWTDKWDVVYSDGSATESDGVLNVYQKYGLDSKTVISGQPIVIEDRKQRLLSYEAYSGVASTTTNDYVRSCDSSYTGEGGWYNGNRLEHGGSNFGGYSWGVDPSSTSFFIYQLIIDGTDVSLMRGSSFDTLGQYVSSTLNTNFDNYDYNVRIQVSHYSGHNLVGKYDWIRVRQYVDTEPTVAMYRVLNVDTGEHFATIQSAVDDSDTLDGHTIEVSPGTYLETVTVMKSLTLTAPDGATIKCPAVPDDIKVAESTKLYHYLVGFFGGTYDGGTDTVSGTDTITIDMSGFTLDADSYVPSIRWASILCRNVKSASTTDLAKIHGNTLNNIDINGHETFGILGYGDMDITIEANVINGFGRGGIGMYSGTASVLENTVNGPGLGVPVTWAPNGIQLGYGASGSIQGNDVSGCGWPGSAWAGTAIMVVDTSNVVVDDNYVHDNEVGIGVTDFPEAIWGSTWAGIVSDITVSNNLLEHNEWGIDIINEASNILVKQNDILDTGGDAIDVYSYEIWYPTYDIPAPTDVVIHHNNIVGSGGDGIWLGMAEGNSMHHNMIDDNDYGGINLYASSSNEVFHNILRINNYYGIMVAHDSSENLIHHNLAEQNDWDGIRIEYASNNNDLHHNKLNVNGNYGLAILSSDYNTMHHNTAMYNEVSDLYWDSTGIGNSWNKNVYHVSIPPGL